MKNRSTRTWRHFICTIAVVIAAIVTVEGTGKASDIDDPSLDVDALTQDRQRGDKFSEDLRKAWDAYKLGNSPVASKLFQKVLDQEQSNESERVQALFGLGINAGYGSPERPEKAVKYFTRLAEEYPQSPTAPWAILKLGQLEGTGSDTQRQAAREHYQLILQKYPESLAIHECAVKLAGTYFHELDQDLTRIGTDLLETHLEKHPDNPLASIMRFRLFYWYEEVERDYERAIVHGVKLGEQRMANPDRWAQQYWAVGETFLHRLNKPQEALRWYKKIVDERPRDLFTYPARQRIIEVTEILRTKHNDKEPEASDHER